MAKGKPLDYYLEQFYTLTGKASDINRNLALAGIAIIWIFRNTNLNEKLLPEILICPLIYFITSLILDLVQYLFSGLSVKFFHRIKERKFIEGKISEKQASNLLYPQVLENVAWLFFVAKLTTMAIGYYFVYAFLTSKL